MRRDGSDAHPLLPGWNNPPAECCGRWTADGKYYVFQSVHRSGTDLWVLPENTRWLSARTPKPIRLTSGPMSWVLPTPSPDEKRIFALGILTKGELVKYDEGSK